MGKYWAFVKKAGYSCHVFLKKYHLVKWILFVALTISVVFSSYLLFLAKTTDVKALKASLEQTTIVYDTNGEEAGRLLNQKGMYVELTHISPSIVDAVLSTEDRRFYTHSGIDYLGIGRAVISFFLNGFKFSGGGSTLTQQLAKNAYLTQQQTFIRKAQEMFLALEIERQYSKDDILTMYLNHAYFGHGVWGVEDASKKYFGKSAKDILPKEAAVIAGMLKSPTYYNPIDYPEYAMNRRNTVLGLMVTNGKLSKEEAEQVSSEPIVLSDTYQQTASYQYPYFFDSVIAEAKDKYGIDEEDILTKGYKIYTTLNQSYQQQLNAAYNIDTIFPNAVDGTIVQSASVVMNASNGGVMAIIGGRGEHVYRGFNRATQMYRQPGSTIKPLAVYAPALENGYTIESILLDEEKTYGDYTPKNWNFVNVGSLPMYQALAESKNTSAVWLLDKIGLQKGLDKLHQFGIQTEKDDEYLGIALGGMTKGTTPLTMTSAYTAFANAGVKQEPYFITKIVDATGALIVNKTHTDSQRVISEKVAQDMTKMMLGVYETGGTGAIVQLPEGLKIAGKTGTSEEYRDQWAIAYTPDFVMTTWMGFDKSDETHRLNGEYANSIYPFFNAAINGLMSASPQTPFQTDSVQSIKKADEKKQKKTWFDNTLDTVKNAGEQIKDGLTNWWNNVIDFINGQ